MGLCAQGAQEQGGSSVEAVVRGNTEFALALYQKVRTVEGNLFFSPYSISTALAMAYAGARGNTETQMAQALHFVLKQEQLHPAFAFLEAKLRDLQREGHIQLRVANALWPQKGYALQDEFLALSNLCYGALVTGVDYRDVGTACATINAWVEEKTEGKIQDMIPSGLLDAMTRLVLVNAIYFKGNWASQFDQSLTRDAAFWVTADEQVHVPMMMNTHWYGYREGDGLQTLELPYAGNNLSMIVLLPKEIDGLTELEERLTVENLGRWLEHRERWQVDVLLPRFEISSPFRLEAALMSMGMVDAFRDAADFSGMDGSKALTLRAVLHKAFAAVTEEGTEAAAATAVAMQLIGLSSPLPVFRADHPFVFLIRENSTGSILFLGRVVNPLSEAA
jgi:serpin B